MYEYKVSTVVLIRLLFISQEILFLFYNILTRLLIYSQLLIFRYVFSDINHLVSLII